MAHPAGKSPSEILLDLERDALSGAPSFPVIHGVSCKRSMNNRQTICYIDGKRRSWNDALLHLRRVLGGQVQS